MSMHTNPLDYVKVAAPCSADWERMTGTEQVRFCDQCKLHVYNLSGMKKREAESLISNTEGRLCVRFYRRADGTILTDNCPVGLRALKRRLSRIATATVSAVFSFLAGVGSYAALYDDNSHRPFQGEVGVMVDVGTAEAKNQSPTETDETTVSPAEDFAIMGGLIVSPPLAR